MSFEPYQSPQTSGYALQPPNSNLATLSLLLGIGSLLAVFPAFCCCLPIVIVLPVALVAIGLGVAALVKIQQGTATGRGLAILGIVSGVLSLLVTVAFFLWVGLSDFSNPNHNPFGPGNLELQDVEPQDVEPQELDSPSE